MGGSGKVSVMVTSVPIPGCGRHLWESGSFYHWCSLASEAILKWLECLKDRSVLVHVLHLPKLSLGPCFAFCALLGLPGHCFAMGPCDNVCDKVSCIAIFQEIEELCKRVNCSLDKEQRLCFFQQIWLRFIRNPFFGREISRSHCCI